MNATRAAGTNQRPENAWSASLTGRFLEALFAAYEEECVRYVVLRNYERWPTDFGSDIDMVIDRNDLDRSHAVIRRLASVFGLHCRARQKRSTHVTYYLFRAPVDGGERGITLDFRIDVVHRGFVYLPGDPILRSRRRHGSFYVPSPALESLAILLHCVIDEREVAERYRARLRELGHGDAEEFFVSAEAVVGRRLARLLLQAIARRAPEDALPLRSRLLIACAFRNPEALTRWLRARIGAGWDLLFRCISPPGRLVVFVGPDGSGKSTIAELLCRNFASTRVPVSLVYLGAQKPLLPTRQLSRFIRKRLAGPKYRRVPKDVGRRVRLRGLLHITMDKWFRYLVHVRPRLIRGGIVVLDRYFYDFCAFPHPLVGRRWVSALVMRIIPKPALAFCMRGDPAVIASRKLELTAAETARQIACYQALAPWLPNLLPLPADGNVREVVDEVSEQVVRLYATEH